MSKNKQILIFSGIGLAVLGGVTAALLLTAPQTGATIGESDAEQVQESESYVLSAQTVENIAKIHVTNASGEYDIIPAAEKDEDGNTVWTISGLEDAPLLTDTIASAVKGIANVEAQQLVEENPAETDKYGLTDPQASVTISYADGTDYSFSYGNQSPTSSTAVYFLDNASHTVYTYKKSAVTPFSGDKFSFIETTVMPAQDTSGEEEIKSLTVDRYDLEEPLIIEQIPSVEGEISVFAYQLTSPYTAYADLTDAPNFMNSLFSLEAQKAVWYGMEEKDYEVSGLSSPTCTITLKTTKKTYKITLGRPVVSETSDENGNISQEITGIYGMCSEMPDVLYLFNYDDIPALSIDPQAVISQLFLMPYIYSLDRVSYSDSEGRSFELAFETTPAETEDGEDTHSHFLNGEPADEQQVKKMYQFLISAAGDELYFDEEKGDLLAQIKYVYFDESRGDDIVSFYSSPSDRRVIININGENVFKSKQIYINQLYKNAENLLNGGEIVLTY